jgi:hypothetical protein
LADARSWARRVGCAAHATPSGVELLCASLGVHLTDLPNTRQIAEALEPFNIRILA